jgi:hypothetical protein
MDVIQCTRPASISRDAGPAIKANQAISPFRRVFRLAVTMKEARAGRYADSAVIDQTSDKRKVAALPAKP